MLMKPQIHKEKGYLDSQPYFLCSQANPCRSLAGQSCISPGTDISSPEDAGDVSMGAWSRCALTMGCPQCWARLEPCDCTLLCWQGKGNLCSKSRVVCSQISYFAKELRGEVGVGVLEKQMNLCFMLFKMSNRVQKFIFNRRATQSA